jgi:hypothetical protein
LKAVSDGLLCDTQCPCVARGAIKRVDSRPVGPMIWDTDLVADSFRRSDRACGSQRRRSTRAEPADSYRIFRIPVERIVPTPWEESVSILN